MSFSDQDFSASDSSDWEDLDCKDIESQIMAAGNYVRPSPDFRPRLLENIELKEQVQRTVEHSLWVSLAVMLLFSFGVGWLGVSIPVRDLGQSLAQGERLSMKDLSQMTERDFWNSTAWPRRGETSVHQDFAWRCVLSACLLRNQRSEALRNWQGMSASSWQ